MSRTIGKSRVVAVIAAAGLAAAGLATSGTPAADAADRGHGTSGIKVSDKDLPKGALDGVRPRAVGAKGGAGEPGRARPAAVPSTGRYAFLLKLSQKSTGAAYQGALGKGVAAATDAAKSQLGSVTTAQNKVIGRLPDKSRVLYRSHAVLAGVTVVTDVRNYQKLTRMAGVAAVYPISPKSASNSYAVPLQQAPQAWTAYGNLGADSTVAIIDTGVDYTHANFGGVGTTTAYDTAKAALGESPDFPSTKVVGGFDFAGDDYNADPTAGTAYNPVPAPDAWPLDCNGHGSHVAGSAAGYGENSDGTTYAGSYDTSTPFGSLRIGPGIAPEAKLLALRVFGCDGSTDLVGAAIDRAADPDGNGDTSDHVDVVNMSLGSDYGSPQDGDSVATEAASALGITMVVASGNAGDIYDVGGSPGNAPSALTVAASRDAYAQVDALTVSAPVAIADDYASERSINYDWATKPDLSGDVVRVADPSNPEGCLPLSPADAAAVNGKIAFVEWTDDDTARPCGSVARSANLAAAGAIGFIFGDDVETFSAGISGSSVIPGVLVAKSGADAIRAQLEASATVTISGTVANGFAQSYPAIDDTIAGFSSRGIGDAGNVKPDVTAVGNTVFSTGSGTGNQGINESGTSMATPMVAGTAALVTTAHPTWSAKQVKADIMNTAGQDIFVGDNHTGARFAPQREGSGRIDAKAALDNDVLAYVAADGGAVSASFGPQAVTADTTLHKDITIENTGSSARSYAVSYVARSTVPGATYSVSPSSISLDPGASTTVTLTLHLDPSLMTKTHDPTVDLLQGGLPRQFQADASGLVVLGAQGAYPDLRVPAYAAPRPASAMTQAGSLTLPAGAVQEALLPLTGQSVSQGTGSTSIRSTVAGFELQAKSGLAPDCSDTVTSGCVGFPDERAADLKNVGATSDAPQLTANGDDPLGGYAYFAINTQGRWRTAASAQELDVSIDSDGDGVVDAVAFTTRLPDTDVLVTGLYDVGADAVVDMELTNTTFGDTDTAVFDSDTVVMPVWIPALSGVSGSHSRISYTVDAFSPYQSDPVDSIGSVDGDGNLVDPLSFDVLWPGVALFGSYDGSASPVLYPDAPTSVLNLRRDSAAYAQDGGLGAMIVHFHNALGEKTQLVSLKDTATVGLALAPNPAQRGQQVTATITVPDSAGTPATGAVRLEQGTTTLASGAVTNGTTQLTFALDAAGVYPLHVEYAGDDTHAAGVSDPVNLTVAKTEPTIGLTLNRTKVHPGQKVKATVQVTTVAGIPPTGQVTIRLRNGRILARGTLTNGMAELRWESRTHSSFKVRAVYVGDANYERGTSPFVKVKVAH